MTALFIDSTKATTTVKLLEKDGSVFATAEINQTFQLSERLVSVIEKILKENKIDKSELSAIFVNPGPGSYTGLRIGIATANALAFSLNIPVSVMKDLTDREVIAKNIGSEQFSTPVLPIYPAPPHITKPKSGPAS